MTTTFCTYVSDEYYHSIGCDKLVKSAKYFHPEIPMKVFGTEDLKQFDVDFGLLHPFVIAPLLEEYDRVIYLDADSIITGELDELFSIKGYDIVGVRNNNDFGKAGIDEPFTQPQVGVWRYMNAGLVCTTSKDFVSDWKKYNAIFGYLLPHKEQNVYNGISLNYKTAIVDTRKSDVYYGVSALSGEESHWDSWKEIQVINDELWLNEKKVKVLHHAGGFKKDKLGFYMFNDQTRKRLITITS